MILIPETGAGIANANSYASLADFAAFADAHLYADAYTAADDDRRARALVMATRVIDQQMQWSGIRATAAQALLWPRAYVDRQPSVAGPLDTVSTFYGASLLQRYWEPTVLPPQLVSATCEFALELLRRDRTAEADEKGIKSLGLGQGAVTIEFDAADRRQIFPPTIARQLSIFGRPGGTGGMASVRRAY